MFYDEIHSPVGNLLIAGDDEGLRRLTIGGRPQNGWTRDAARARSARRELDAYFAGELQRFSLVLAPIGTPFQHMVWRALMEIPFGATESYGALARKLGRPNGARAVGSANGKNPIAIVVPCHRVIGANGSLTGYAHGVACKRALLEHERAS